MGQFSLIKSNPKALTVFNQDERKSELGKKTNIELRKSLKNIEGISRLKKSELIDKILSIEFGEKE